MINFGLERVNTSECNALMNLSQCSLPIYNQQARRLTVLLSPSATSSAWLQNSDSWTSQSDGVTSGHNVLCYAVVSLSTQGNAKTFREIPRKSLDRRESDRVETNKCSPTFSFPHQCSVCISLLPYTCHMSCQSHPPLFNRPDNIKWRLQVEYCQHKPQILHHEVPMYVGIGGTAPRLLKSVRKCKQGFQLFWICFILLSAFLVKRRAYL
jgi:hypothetical protein